MKRRTSHRFVLVLGIILLLTVSISIAETNTIILPKGGESQFGDGAVSPFFSGLGPEQQVYGSSEFSEIVADTITVTGLSFRLNNHSSGASMDAVISRVRLRMGVFSGSLSEVSTDFSVNLTNPVTVFDMEQVRLKAEGGQPASAFDISFAFQTPYIYDRRQGHLVLEILALGGHSGPSGSIDAHSAFDQGVYVYSEPMGFRRKMSVMMATKLFYLPKSAVIGSIRLNTNRVEIEFVATGEPKVIRVESAARINGPFSSEENAQITAILGDQFRATIPLGGPIAAHRFFRISLQ